MSEFVIECWYDIDDGWIAGEYREEVVRCRDCVNASVDEFGGGWCCENRREIKPWNFCCWGDGGDTE